MELPLDEQMYQIRHALSPETCANYIQHGDAAGWEPTDVGKLNPSFSRSQTYIAIDLQAIFDAILPYLPQHLDGMEIAYLARQRTACMRYSEGEYLGVHTDVPFIADDGAITKYSLVLYLNDGYDGGETAFPKLALEVKPEVGKILLFSPNVSHLSNPITRGAKYIIRSEVMYRPARDTEQDT